MTVELYMNQGNPTLSVNKNGAFYISSGAVRRYGLKVDQRYILGYDKENKIIVLQLTDDKVYSGIRLRENTGGSGLQLSASGFLRFFGLSFDSGKINFPLEQDPENPNILMVHLTTS